MDMLGPLSLVEPDEPPPPPPTFTHSELLRPEPTSKCATMAATYPFPFGTTTMPSMDTLQQWQQTLALSGFSGNYNNNSSSLFSPLSPSFPLLNVNFVLVSQPTAIQFPQMSTMALGQPTPASMMPDTGCLVNPGMASGGSPPLPILFPPVDARPPPCSTAPYTSVRDFLSQSSSSRDESLSPDKKRDDGGFKHDKEHRKHDGHRIERKRTSNPYVDTIRASDLCQSVENIEIPVQEAYQFDPKFRASSEEQIVYQIVNKKDFDKIPVRDIAAVLCKKLAEKRVFGPKLMAQTTVAGPNHSIYRNLPDQGIIYIQHVCRKVLSDRLASEDEFWDVFTDAMKKLAARCRRVRHTRKQHDSAEPPFSFFLPTLTDVEQQQQQQLIQTDKEASLARFT